MNKKPVSSSVHSLFWVCVFFLVFHFSMLALYTVPGLPAPKVMQNVARSYTFPMFHQGWRLFAPRMRTFENNLEYRYANEGEWSEWKGLGREGTDDVPRLAYFSSKVAMKLHSTCNDSINGIYYIDKVAQTDAVEKSADYIRSAYMCYKHSVYFYNITPDSVQLKLGYRFIPDHVTGEADSDLLFIFSPYDTREG